MSPAPAPTPELLDTLAQAEAALARGDTDSANATMALAAQICRQMHEAGKVIPDSQLGPLQGLAARCGSSLARLESELNAESVRDDNHRRGLLTYQASLRR